MTLDQLEMLEAIIQEGSYQAAAKRIKKSQPSLSTGIKKIEDLYGIKIFSRAGYRPALTNAGRRFYEDAKIALSSYRQLHRTAMELGAGQEAELKVSIDPIVLASRALPLFNRMKSGQYKAMLSIESGILFDNAKKVLNKSVDLAIGHLPQVDGHDVESKKVCDIELIPVIHKSLIQGKQMSQSMIQATPNIVVKSNARGDDYISSQSELKWFVDSHSRKIELIALGIGWGRISIAQFKQFKNLVRIPEKVVESVKFEVFLMRHRLTAHGPIAKQVWADFI